MKRPPGIQTDKLPDFPVDGWAEMDYSPPTAHRRARVCIVIFAILLVGLAPSLRAQQRSAAPHKMPSAEKIMDSYLRAIGGRKRAATIRDATYEWTIQLKDRT